MPEPAIADLRAFILGNTRLRAVAHVPELRLHVAEESVPLWQRTEEELGRMGVPAPFWAFAWAGGQALGRYILDHPWLVAGKRVLDLGSGSGLVAIATAMAGGVPVVASDIDPFAEQAIALNAEANGAYVEVLMQDLLGLAAPRERRYDLILVGDLFYEETMAARVLSFLDRHAALGTDVLIGDPGRSYLPRPRLAQRCEYHIPVSRDLEDQDIKRSSVWALVAPA